MAAKSKKRLIKNENKLLKLEKLELEDVVCTICQSILIEPVTLPCYHYFCQRCFNGSVENNALCCPLCRLRIGSWLRTATKQNSLVNSSLWEYMKVKFAKEIDTKLNGDDVVFPEEKPTPRLSAPGEIRSEYEAELKRLRIERMQLEQKHLHETEILIKKLQQEERDAQNRYTARLKQDELLAQKLQKENSQNCNAQKTQKVRAPSKKLKPKVNTIDSYLAKTKPPSMKESPLITDDNTTSTDTSTPNTVKFKPSSKASPEMIPSYGKLIKSFIDKKIKTSANFWNKENGDKGKIQEIKNKEQDKDDNCDPEKPKNGIKSLLVSLPLPSSGIPQRTVKLPEYRSLQTESVDSMHQELCYFKPIEHTTPMSESMAKSGPVRVPGVRARPVPPSPEPRPAPSRAMYIEGLCHLRHLSLATNLPSAFVLALNILNTKESSAKCTTVNNNNSKVKRTAPPLPPALPSPPKKHAPNKSSPGKQLDNSKSKHTLRRTRSMGSIKMKQQIETTPKKAKIQERKATSERKPHLRSDSKKLNAKKRLMISPHISEEIGTPLAVKDLSSPLKKYDLKNILQEQLKIEELIRQEQRDLELARKMDMELNGRRPPPRRCAAKRQVTMNYALRPAKKLKI